MLRVLNFKTIIEQDEDGYFIASVPSVPGCYSQGETYEEAVGKVKEALELALEVAKDTPGYKRTITFPTKSAKEKFIGVLDLPVKFASK